MNNQIKLETNDQIDLRINGTQIEIDAPTVRAINYINWLGMSNSEFFGVPAGGRILDAVVAKLNCLVKENCPPVEVVAAPDITPCCDLGGIHLDTREALLLKKIYSMVSQNAQLFGFADYPKDITMLDLIWGAVSRMVERKAGLDSVSTAEAKPQHVTFNERPQPGIKSRAEWIEDRVMLLKSQIGAAIENNYRKTKDEIKTAEVLGWLEEFHETIASEAGKNKIPKTMFWKIDWRYR